MDLLLGVTSRQTRVAVFVDPANSVHAAILKSVREATRGTAVSILPVEARTGAEIAEAMSQASREKAGAILVGGGLFNGYRREIADLAIKYRLPSISAAPAFARAGGLMSYGQNSSEQSRRAAVYVDKLFKGAKPADLPVEQPTKFELVINMKTARMLGITVPQSILVRADRVIE